MSEQRSGDRTEKATPRKRRQARENAQVLKSTELVVAFSLLAMFGILALVGEGSIRGLKNMMTGYLSRQAPETLTAAGAGAALLEGLATLATVVGPLLLACLLCGLVLNYLQVGFLFSPKSMMPKGERISPLSGMKRIFSRQSLAQLVKALIKLAVLGVVAYRAFTQHLPDMPGLMWYDPDTAAAYVGRLLLNVAFDLALGLAVLAPVDYFYEWRKREKELMMTKQEVRDEYKLTEGDPKVKGRIRQKQRQISGMRMIQAVQQADVVVTNPTHYAVALVYEEGKNRAPVVLAKGKDHLARRIREKAQEAGVQRVENRELARALYFFCDIGDEVPEDLYQAVAEILAYVYKLKNRRGGRES